MIILGAIIGTIIVAIFWRFAGKNETWDHEALRRAVTGEDEQE